MKINLILLAVILVLVLALPGYCIDPLSFYTSARPMGMGGAFTAVDNDIAGILYNPACRIEESKSIPIKSELLVGGDYLGTYNNDKIHSTYVLNVGNIFILKGNLINTRQKDIKLQNDSYETGLVFSRRMFENLSCGMSIQNRYSDITFEGSANSISANTVDLGVLYHLNDNISIGIVEKNAYTIDSSYKYHSKSGKPVMDPGGSLGIAYKLNEKRDLASFDIGSDDLISGAPFYKMGYEWKYGNNMAIRFGEALFTDKETQGINSFGLSFGPGIDYAVQIQGGGLTQFISFHVDAGVPAKPK